MALLLHFSFCLSLACCAVTGKLQIACRVCVASELQQLERSPNGKQSQLIAALGGFFFGAEKCATVFELAEKKRRKRENNELGEKKRPRRVLRKREER